MLQAEAGFELSHSLLELTEFVGVFLSVGAVGFRFASLRGRVPDGDGEAGSVSRIYSVAARRAAVIGLVGALIYAGRYAYFLPRMAARSHTTVAGLLTTPGRPLFSVILMAIGLVGFVMASGGRRAGWTPALMGAVGPQALNILSGRPGLMINSTHQLAGGLWIGSLFLMVGAGLAVALRPGPERAQGWQATSEMVRGFSPMALTAAAFLVTSGVWTAYRHLDGWGSLLGSAYGNALLVKLALVAMVFALGAWNWRRGIPRLDGEDGALAIQRSARAEALVALLVVLATSVLVTLPAPAEGTGGPPPPAPTAAAPR